MYKKFFLYFTIGLMFFYSGCHRQDTAYKELTLAQNEITLYVGQSEKIKIMDEENPLLYQYISTNSAINVRSDGVITAESIGSAVIVVKAADGRCGSCYVVVKENRPVDIESLTITNKIKQMMTGDQASLHYSKTPSNADNYYTMKWVSSDDQIVSVDEKGGLIAVSPGTCTISLLATGTEYYDKFDVIVLARASQLSLDYKNVFGKVRTSDLQITPTLVTDYRNVELGVWKTEDENVATVDIHGKVSFHNVGKTKILYEVNTPTEKLIATCQVAVGEKDGYTIIRTPQQLQDIGNISGNYALGNDIDLAEACAYGGALYHNGYGFTPLFNGPTEAFTGVFDGQGYKIKNLYMKTNQAFSALFRYINTTATKEGVIKNLALCGGKIEGINFVGAFTGNIVGSGSAIAGVKNCWTDIELVSSGSSGGLSGYNGGLIENCYSLSKITAQTDMASISLFVKDKNPTIGVRDTYVNQDIQSNISYLVLPSRVYSSILEASYKTTSEMKNASLYETWDNTIWKIFDGEYPQLICPND